MGNLQAFISTIYYPNQSVSKVIPTDSRDKNTASELSVCFSQPYLNNEKAVTDIKGRSTHVTGVFLIIHQSIEQNLIPQYQSKLPIFKEIAVFLRSEQIPSADGLQATQ
jgi:hypothetical protein